MANFLLVDRLAAAKSFLARQASSWNLISKFRCDGFSIDQYPHANTNPDYYKDGNRHKEVLRRATLYCKNGILYENAIVSLVGQFGEKSRAGLNDADICSMVNSCYNKARQDFGVDRANYVNLIKKQK